VKIELKTPCSSAVVQRESQFGRLNVCFKLLCGMLIFEATTAVESQETDLEVATMQTLEPGRLPSIKP
jgi:hypothetical protein